MQIDVKLTGVATALLIAGCASSGSRNLVGAGPACGGPATRATLVRNGGEVALSPTNGSIVLRGTVDPAGHLQASWSPPVRGTKSRKQPLATQTVTGTLDAGGAHLRFVAPGCEVPLELRRPVEEGG